MPISYFRTDLPALSGPTLNLVGCCADEDRAQAKIRFPKSITPRTEAQTHRSLLVWTTPFQMEASRSSLRVSISQPRCRPYLRELQVGSIPPTIAQSVVVCSHRWISATP